MHANFRSGFEVKKSLEISIRYYFRHSFQFKRQNNYSFSLHTINTYFYTIFYTVFTFRIIKDEFGSGLTKLIIDSRLLPRSGWIKIMY